MKISKKTIIASIAVIWLPCLIGLALWYRLPEQVPTHWNMNNEIDGWSRKGILVFGMPAFMTAMQIFLLFMHQNDPKRQNISRKLFGIMVWFLPGMSVVMCLVSYCAALGMPVNTGIAVNLFLGILLIVMGNYLPKSRQSYTMGIKLPWTLSSEENWNRTHRLAGWLWIGGGILFLINSFFLSSWLLWLVLILITGIPGVYSYRLYKKGI